MVNTKLLVGIGFLGVAVYAYSQLEMPTTTNGDLSPNGGGLYVSPNGNGDDDTYAPDCSSMWDTSGNRINDEWINHGQQQIGPWSRIWCDVNGSDVRVYTDKSVYYAGEPINVYVLKMYYQTPGLLHSSHHWEKWANRRSFRGETMKFFLGVEGDRVLKSFTDSGGVTSSLPSSFNLLSPEQIEEYGVVKYRISTTSNSAGVYDLRFGTQLGPYQLGSRCGSSACLDGQDSITKKCNIREMTSPTQIVILSRDCKNPPQASSAETFNAFQDESKKAITSGRRSGESVRDYLTREWRNRRLLYSTYRRKLPHQIPDNSRIPSTPKRGRYENIDKNELAKNWISSQSFLTEWV